MVRWNHPARFWLKVILRVNELGIDCALSCGWRLSGRNSSELADVRSYYARYDSWGARCCKETFYSLLSGQVLKEALSRTYSFDFVDFLVETLEDFDGMMRTGEDLDIILSCCSGEGKDHSPCLIALPFWVH
jgi:hypothetical protein